MPAILFRHYLGPSLTSIMYLFCERGSKSSLSLLLKVKVKLIILCILSLCGLQERYKKSSLFVIYQVGFDNLSKLLFRLT